MKKRIVKKVDVVNVGDAVQVHFYLFDLPKRVFSMHPATWLRMFEFAKSQTLDLSEVVDSLYHSALLQSAENKLEVLQ